MPVQNVLILWVGDIKMDLEELMCISMRVDPELPQIAEGVNTLIQMISNVVTWRDN